MIYKEYIWTKNIIVKYCKNPLFYVYEIIMIYILWKLWYLYLLFILYVVLSAFLLLLKKEPKIVFRKKKTSIFINYFKINVLKSLESSKLNKNFILSALFFYFFRIIFGISYKLIRMSLSLFDALHTEYVWADIASKKMKKKIIKKFLSKSIENFVFTEFIKSIPALEKEIVIKIKKIEKKIKIII